MAESGNFSETESYENAPRRRHFHQNRPPYSPRGRGRTDPHVMKALHNFGVRDLRELLDRKHQDEQDQEEQQPIAPRGRGRYIGPSEHSFIQNPINIKVQLMTATGERNYSLSQDDKLLDIKHIPDHDEQANELDWGRGRHNRSLSGLERGRGGSSYRDRGSSYRGRGLPDRGRGSLDRGRGLSDRGRYEIGMANNEADWCNNESSRGRKDTHRGRHDTSRGRSRYETNRGYETDRSTSDSNWEIYETAKGRHYSDGNRYETSKSRPESNLDMSEPERDRRNWGRNDPDWGRHETARGRHNSNKHSGRQVTDWNGGEPETDWDGNETERSGRVSDRGRSEYRRGRGRDPRGRGGPMRAKSIERARPLPFETENRVRGAKVRSRSAETRGDNDTKNEDGGAKGKGRGGRGRSMERGRGRGGWKTGRNKREQTNMTNDINNASSEIVGIIYQDNWDDEATGSKTELEHNLNKTYNETTGVQENDFDDALEDYGVSDLSEEKYDEKYADEAEEEAEEEIQDGQPKINEKEKEIVEIKENLIITSDDHKQKKRTVRFDLGKGEKQIETAESVEKQLETPGLREKHGIEELALESSS
ncbi:unnamed protein product [Phaedon cochleariae]|uniref:Uncharacterized protein n=1 Tax=Phaedon cochleariae TaxID=80249 RepID=A0A9N9X4J7_PHACE|nr:unnamed protein product [Phaedon cochleariae]